MMFRKIPILAIGFGLLLAAGPLAAQEAARGLVLGPGDELSVSVLNREDLSRTYRVRDDGTVSLHLIGDVQASGRTIAGFESSLEELVAAQTELPVSISVEVSAWRPVYALGDVAQPGEISFRQGMTVGRLMAVAGGAFPREGELAGSPLKVRIAEQQAEISVRLSKLADLHAKRLRLQAEQSDAVELTADGTISALAGDEAGTLIGEQQAILQSRADFQNVQAAAARAQAELAAGEADSLARQQDILRQQIESSAEVLANMENLLSRGLTNSERVRQIRSYYNEDKIELMLAASYEARAHQNRVNLLTSVDQMERAQVREDAAALADVMAAIRGEEAAIAASRRMIRELAAVEAEEPDSGFLQPLEFRIRRSKPGGETILPAAMDTVVEPGDLVEFRRGGFSAPAKD